MHACLYYDRLACSLPYIEMQQALSVPRVLHQYAGLHVYLLLRDGLVLIPFGGEHHSNQLS